MFQISNMTAIASNVNNLVTARAAYDNIFQNTTGGVLPFQVDVGAGHMVNPRQVELKVIDGSSVMPTPSATVKPVAVTVTPSSCPSVPAQLHTFSTVLCPSPVPSGTGKTYSRGYVAGIAFGMILLGSTTTLLAIFVGNLIYSKHKQRFSLRTGYERQVNT